MGGALETMQSKLTSLERPYALNQALLARRPGGTVSLPGGFIGPAVPIALGPFVGKGLTMKTGQTHVQRYLAPLMKLIADGKIDPAFFIIDRVTIEEGPDAYKRFRDKENGCMKVVISPKG